VHLRIWLRKRGGVMNEALQREASDVARRWFDYVTAVFRVVEDCPPYEAQWTNTPRDVDDRPIWTAAVRAGAQIIVTENLKDGPPADSNGLQIWGGILFIHPEKLIQTLDWLGSRASSGRAPVRGYRPPSQTQEDDAADEPQLTPDVVRFLLNVEERAAVDLPPAE
jgi:hypothetical protein